MRDVFEDAIAFVQEKLGWAIFVSDKQVQKTIVIDVHPNRGLSASGMLGQPARLSHISEGAVAVVAQQGLSLRDLPASAKHEDVNTAVIVEIGLNNVQCTQLVRQARCFGLLGKRSITVVMEILHGSACIETGFHHVEAPIVFEIVNDNSAGHGKCIKSGLWRDISKTSYILAGLEISE